MGKPNIAKMANFLEIDIFVLVACPENSLIDSQEFYKPIITPFELEIACSRQRSWTGEYITDYREILPDDKWLTDMEEKDGLNVVEEPEYSLISGNLIKNMNMNEQGMLLLLLSSQLFLRSFFANFPRPAHSSLFEILFHIDITLHFKL